MMSRRGKGMAHDPHANVAEWVSPAAKASVRVLRPLPLICMCTGSILHQPRHGGGADQYSRRKSIFSCVQIERLHNSVQKEQTGAASLNLSMNS